jgi:hypothetical protein
MMKRNYWIFAAPLLIGAAPPLSADIRADVRCLLAIGLLGANPDPAIKMSGMIGTQYYFGRIDARVDTIDLEKVLATEVATLTDAEIPSLLKSCGARMKSRGELLSAIGNRMKDSAVPSSSPSS